MVAQRMREAGHSLVEVEPQLQELSGEVFDYKSANKEADARSDIKCCGFGLISDRRILTRRWSHLLPEAMLV